MPRKRNPLGISRTQILLPTPDRKWLETQAKQRDTASKANGGHAVKMSHLVTNAVEFFEANTELVDGWIRSRQSVDTATKKEVRDALRFFRGNRKLGRAFLRGGK
jgi:hypothetical protein